MSQIKLKQPVVHTPTFNKWGIQRYALVQKLKELGIGTFPKTSDFVLDNWYYYTDLEGWAKILPDLVLNSGLYRTNIFDCEDYGLKAQIECADRYGLNAMRLCIGEVPEGGHGFNLLFYGGASGIEGALLFEPNGGFEWGGNAFEIGENGYVPKMVFIAGAEDV